MPSDYRKMELLGKATNFIPQSAKMLVGATHKHRNIVGSGTPGDQNRLIGNQDLLQSISHRRILGGPPRDSEQRCIFRRERFCIYTKIRRRMDLKPACRTDKDRSLQLRDLISQ